MENSMCRICLATDVRLCSIPSYLRDMFERISSMTFKREDWRPLVACYICHARLQNCYRLRTSCLRSEELLTEMMSSGVLKPQDVLSTNTLRVVPVLHLSLEPALQDSTECHVKEEPSEFKGIKMEPQEEQDAQIDNDIQCLHLEDLLGTMKREPDDVELDDEDLKLKIENTVLEENEKNDAGGPASFSQSANNIFPKIVKVELERMVLNDTIPATGVPELKKLEENESFLVTESENVNKSFVVNKLMCDVCSKCFTYKFELTKHMFTHTDKKRFQCDVCNKCFTNNGVLRRHMFIHNVKKHFQCDVCKKRFANKPYLTNHMYIHIYKGKSQFQCDVCSKCFTYKSSLKQHMYTHTDKKRFQCHVCNKCYTSKSILTRHMFIHTDKKRFQCDVCNQRFTYNFNLTRHRFTHTDKKLML